MKNEAGLALLMAHVVQTTGAMIFILVARSPATAWLKYLILALMVAVLMRIVYTQRNVGFHRAQRQILGLALGATMTQQLIGFSIFPGLLKDIVPFSYDHAILTLVTFATVAFGYSIAFTAVRIFERCLR